MISPLHGGVLLEVSFRLKEPSTAGVDWMLGRMAQVITQIC